MTDANATPEPAWYRLEVLTTQAELVSYLLWESGAQGVEIQDHETFMIGDVIVPLPEGQARIIAFFEGDPREAGIEATLAATGAVEPPMVAPFNDRSWETAWKAWFKPLALSRRLMVGPPWEDFAAPEGGHRVIIEPGMAFGTGTHETTRVSAHVIDEILAADVRPQGPLSLLDVGCGSAILAIGALLLGARPVVGIDIDPTAIRVAGENLVVNGVEGQIDLSTTPLHAIEGAYDVVVANIQIPILYDLQADLFRCVAPGGHLLISGVTTEQAEAFVDRFLTPEWRLIERRDMGEWIAVHLRRSAD